MSEVYLWDGLYIKDGIPSYLSSAIRGDKFKLFLFFDNSQNE